MCLSVLSANPEPPLAAGKDAYPAGFGGVQW